MFSKHVWYDRKHQAEVYTTAEGVLSGTLVAYDGAVALVNPRPEILLALYQEAKIRRILGVRAVVLTADSMDFTRGLCAFVNYCRGLRRRSALEIISHEGASISMDFLSSCCAKLWGDSEFEVRLSLLAPNEPKKVGAGHVRFVASEPGGAQYLEVTTLKGRTLHYYDERHAGPVEPTADASRPNVVIRAARVPSVLNVSRRILEGVAEVR